MLRCQTVTFQRIVAQRQLESSSFQTQRIVQKRIAQRFYGYLSECDNR